MKFITTPYTRLIIFMCLLSSNYIILAQNLEHAVPTQDSVYNTSSVDQKPSFPSGEDSLLNYITENTIGEVKLIKGIGGGCDNEALRIGKAMPR